MLSGMLVAGLVRVAAGSIETPAMENPLVFGNNRITLITPTLFRLESTTDGRFIDERTMFAYDRTSLLAD